MMLQLLVPFLLPLSSSAHAGYTGSGPKQSPYETICIKRDVFGGIYIIVSHL